MTTNFKQGSEAESRMFSGNCLHANGQCLLLIHFISATWWQIECVNPTHSPTFLSSYFHLFLYLVFIILIISPKPHSCRTGLTTVSSEHAHHLYEAFVYSFLYFAFVHAHTALCWPGTRRDWFCSGILAQQCISTTVSQPCGAPSLPL